MKFTDKGLTISDLQSGDIIVEQDRYFMVVKLIGVGSQENYGYMNMESGVVLPQRYDSAIEMYDDCFSPTRYDTQVRVIDEVVLKNL